MQTLLLFYASSEKKFMLSGYNIVTVTCAFHVFKATEARK